MTCKELPELITYGRTLDEALENAEDAFNAVIEAYEEQGRSSEWITSAIEIPQVTD